MIGLLFGICIISWRLLLYMRGLVMPLPQKQTPILALLRMPQNLIKTYIIIKRERHKRSKPMAKILSHGEDYLILQSLEPQQPILLEQQQGLPSLKHFTGMQQGQLQSEQSVKGQMLTKTTPAENTTNVPQNIKVKHLDLFISCLVVSSLVDLSIYSNQQQFVQISIPYLQFKTITPSQKAITLYFLCWLIFAIFINQLPKEIYKE